MTETRHARVKALFLAASRLPPGERVAYLDERCAGDDGLRRDVESLLRHDDVAVVEGLGRALGFEASTPSPAPDTPPREVGPYLVLRRLGEGGMGEVYEAEQQAPVRRRVALKLIKRGMDTKEVIARFESERQALALMSHPGIAAVFDAGTTAEGRPYFVMEYVPGEPITTYCDRHHLTVRERLDLFTQVCEAVQHAHQKGVIHRDLKPSNVLVAVRDGRPMPKIIDFGVAKATSRPLTERTLFTELGQWVGTPEYMSPEQAEMTGLDIDTRSDVYSLGVVLYELLVGAQPFDPDELRRAGLDGVRRILREVDPPTPSLRVRDLARASREAASNRRLEASALVNRLRGDLDWITMKALEKDRTRRYGSPSELAADIGRHLRHEPVSAGPPGAAYRIGKFARRHRLGVGAGAVVAAALILGIVGTTLGLLEAGRQRDSAERAQDAAEHEAAKAQAINQFLQQTLSAADPVEGQGHEVTILDALDAAAARAGESLGDQPEIEAAVHHTIGRTYQALGQYDVAERWLTSALRARERVFGRAHADVAESLAALGELALVARDDPDTADRLLREALALRRDLLGAEHLDVADTLDKLAWVRSVTADYEEALGLVREALAIERRVNGRESPRVLDTLAVLEHYLGEYEASDRDFRRGLDILRADGRETSLDAAMLLTNQASMLYDAGDDARAEALLREALVIQRERQGASHPAVAATVANLAMTLVRQQRDDDARQLYADAIAAYPEVLDRNLPHYAQRRIGYGILLSRRRRYGDAERHLLAGFETFRFHLGPDDPRTRGVMADLANLYEAWGRPDEAAEYRRRLRENGSGGS